MIKNLTTSDLNAILARIKADNTKLWYSLEMNAKNDEKAEKAASELKNNSNLITEIEDEINSRIFQLK